MVKPKRVGLLVGRERSFPEALIAEIARRDQGVVAEYARLEATRSDRPPPYDVLLDRISHDVSCYQPVCKVAALHGVRVVNNPFWRIADDKFFDAALAQKLGIRVPKSIVLPSCEYHEDVNAQSLTNLDLVDWNAIINELGFPMYIKPHWGGGWRDVSRVSNQAELFSAYHQSKRLTMFLQEEIQWTQYVRCIVVGREEVRPALWDPRRSHFERYRDAAQSMPPLSRELEATVVDQAKRLCDALGYDMNTVEFAIKDGVPYAIDFMNSAPDLDISSLGDEHFRWVVGKMADHLIKLAKEPAAEPATRWDRLMYGGGEAR